MVASAPILAAPIPGLHLRPPPKVVVRARLIANQKSKSSLQFACIFDIAPNAVQSK
jgi:hypothetical protein